MLEFAEYTFVTRENIKKGLVRGALTDLPCLLLQMCICYHPHKIEGAALDSCQVGIIKHRHLIEGNLFRTFVTMLNCNNMQTDKFDN